MEDDNFEVECSKHGTTKGTFVCFHIVNNESKKWFSSEPFEDDPYPDAWCDKCHVHFEKEWEWNERTEAAAGGGEQIAILCERCYENKRDTCEVFIVE